MNEKPMKTIIFREKLTNDDHTSVGDSLTFTQQAATKAKEGKAGAATVKEETTSSADDESQE